MALLVLRIRLAAASTTWRSSSARRFSISMQRSCAVRMRLSNSLSSLVRKALGVHQSLLALVVVGNVAEVRLGDFYVITEDGIEADLERLDTGPGTLAVFDLGNGFASRTTDSTELVELDVDGFADDSAIGQGEGWLGHEGYFYSGLQFFQACQGGLRIPSKAWRRAA